MYVQRSHSILPPVMFRMNAIPTIAGGEGVGMDDGVIHLKLCFVSVKSLSSGTSSIDLNLGTISSN